MTRVVITGMGFLSPIGNSWQEARQTLASNESGVTALPEWQEFFGLRSHLAGKVSEADLPEYNRKQARSMSKASLFAVRATELALEEAGLTNHTELFQSGELGIAYGSCLGGPEALMQLALANAKKDVRGIAASSYVKVMSHSCAATISLFFGVKGRLIPTNSACTSGSQAIGFAYEAIKSGKQKIMIAGGAEELCVGITSLFDSMFATSVKNNSPKEASRPFDKNRDGLVISEGACTVVLESLESAKQRGAPILAEVVGFGTNCNGTHVTNPDQESMAVVMQLSLQDASLSADAIDFIHAHATATEIGDIIESNATYHLFKDAPLVSALKSYTGHTLGASGSLESCFAIRMMNDEWFAPIKNLDEVDPRCAPLRYIKDSPAKVSAEHIMVNNFAFGGVNTSLIFKRWR